MFLSNGKIKFYYIVLTANISSLMCGVLLTWTSPILPKLNSNSTMDQNPLGRVITDDEQSWIASLSSIGGIIGPPIFGFIMEVFGRKMCIAFVHIPNMISALCAAFGTNVWYFYISRLFAGSSISSGMVMTAVYFGEIGESHNRGLLYSTSSVLINVGTLFSYCVGAYTSIRTFNIILCGIAIYGLVTAILFLPESPYFLVQKGKFIEAHKSLSALRSSEDVDSEIKIIREDVSKVQNDGVFALFATKAARRAFTISFIITTLQQFAGIGSVYSYTQTIFQKAGSNLSSEVSSILVGVAQFVTIFMTPLGVERFGRKSMLLFASSGLSVTLAILGTFFYLQDQTDVNVDVIKWLPLLCLILYFLFFNSGMGGLPFLLMSELLPLNVRSAGSSLVSSSYWFSGFIVTYFYTSLNNAIQASGTFWLFSGASFVFAVYTFFFVFETKGKTLQEILDHSNNKKTKQTRKNESEIEP